MRMGFYEVTGGRALSFRNLSVGEPAGPDMSGKCGVPQAGHGLCAEKTKSRSLDRETEKKPILILIISFI